VLGAKNARVFSCVDLFEFTKMKEPFSLLQATDKHNAKKHQSLFFFEKIIIFRQIILQN
jgi:hypothetical protein